MGNVLACVGNPDASGETGSRRGQSSKLRSDRRTRSASSEVEALHQRALAIAIQQHRSSQRFDGSMSRRTGGSMSSRRVDLSDPVHNGKQRQVILEEVETKKIVLVHGEGFGAWCWYKTLSLLEEAGLHPVALDLTGSGIDRTDSSRITTLADYSRPLTDYLHSLHENEKVILVGHSCGGASISYALERYPNKISKAIFLSATMVLDAQRPFNAFSELAPDDVFLKESKFLVHGNGRDKPPTGLMFDKQQMKGWYFNQSPSKDVALAGALMRPIPLAPIMEKLSLTAEKYGTVRRFFIQTLDDRVLSPEVQEKLAKENPPQGIYQIKGSDHCPFFSKPQLLHKILLEITQLP